MAGRFPEQIPEGLEKEWTSRLGVKVRRWMESIQAGMGGLQGTPATPSEIQAGATADAGTSQAAAPSDHTHAVDTAAPSVKVSYDQAPAEGVGTALMRADARLRLEDGVTSGDFLQWNGTIWVSVPIADIIADNDVLNWLDL